MSMTSKHYSPIILERFTAWESGRRPKGPHGKSSPEKNSKGNYLAGGKAKHKDGNSLRNIAIFDDKSANAVLHEAEMHLKSGYPTIATSSMVARTINTTQEYVDNASGKRLLSEIVKPLQHRWRFQKNNLKTITPTKEGFQRRSQSPTFQTLVEANKKLQNMTSKDLDVNDSDFVDRPKSVLRSNELENVNTRPSYESVIPETRDVFIQNHSGLKPDVRTIELENNISEREPRRSPSLKVETLPIPPPPPPQPVKSLQQEFKVDFKKSDSRSELHLFLPYIQDGNSRGATPEEPNRKRNEKVSLPAIEDLEIKILEEDKSKTKKKHKHDIKKKKKHSHKLKSVNGEKVLKDHLNDIPTLISLETDKDSKLEPMLYRHRKSNRIRQA